MSIPTVQLLPTLYQRTKSGKIQQWRTWSDGDTVWTEWGQMGGRLQTSSKVCEATNVGQANMRIPEMQADFEAGALWRSKRDEGYVDDVTAAREALSVLPMLAHTLDDPAKLASLKEFDVQTKLDGVRAMARWSDDGSRIELTSRGGKPYSIPHIERELAAFLPKGFILDGEMYVKGLKCQEITSLVKRPRKETEVLSYMVFDLPYSFGTRDFPWRTRRVSLENLFSTDLKPATKIAMVPTDTFDDYRLIEEAHKMFVEDGFEGLMVRFPDSRYEWGNRSRGLLKYKHFQDAEFKVVGVGSGVGKLANAAIFRCENDDASGKQFDVIFAGTQEQREEQLANAQKYLGQQLTVRFFDRTGDNLPRFPVGVAFRGL